MKQIICTNCGFIGLAGKEKKGSLVLEVVLWLCYILPGLLYTIWRRSNKKSVCPKCKQGTLVPIDSPVGQKIMKENHKIENSK